MASFGVEYPALDPEKVLKWTQNWASGSHTIIVKSLDAIKYCYTKIETDWTYCKTSRH